jgi:hypothetical protein
MARNVGGSIRVTEVATRQRLLPSTWRRGEKHMSALFRFRCSRAFPWIAERKFGAAS